MPNILQTPASSAGVVAFADRLNISCAQVLQRLMVDSLEFPIHEVFISRSELQGRIMLGKCLLSAAVVASSFVFAGSADAGTTKGICAVTASVHGGKKFATLKCAKVSEPSNYEIRSTVWEKEDRKAYGNLARFAGRRFTCDLVRGGTTRDNNSTESTHYELENCK